MKTNKLILASAVLCGALLASCGGGAGGEEAPKLDGDYSIKVWCAELAAPLMRSQLQKAIASLGEGVNVEVEVQEVGEGDASSKMMQDVESGADIYCFAQDQLAALVNAKALAEVGGSRKTRVTERNDGGSVKAASLEGKMYAFPLTSDNGYFMYYNKSIIKEESLGDILKVMDDAKAADKLVSFNLGSAWYNASFFFGMGCVSEWTTNEAGDFVAYNDTYNTEAGVKACQAMREVVRHPAYNDSSAGGDFAKSSAVVISGTWDYNTVKDTLGDDFGVAELPYFTVGGERHHLGSFSGNKLMGVKPQQDAKKAAVCQTIADYLTNEASQIERYNTLKWGPSNKNAQNTDAVKADPALYALAKQNNYATPQGQYPSAWWDLAGAISNDLAQTDTEPATILANYADAISALVVE